MKKQYLIIFTFILLNVCNTLAQKKNKTIHLFDADLSYFEKWNGVPHTSVNGLPEGTYQSNKITEGIPLGLNNDIKKTFSVINENGEYVLKITGEIYGGLITKASYENYHLSVMFKWGDKKWAPRLKLLRDSGIIYHSYGKYGSFWKTWKCGLEYQVQENDLGDYIGLGDHIKKPKAEIRGTNGVKRNQYNPNVNTYITRASYTNASKELDAPHGEWNHLEIYVLSNYAIHLVNGEIVLVIENAISHEGDILNKGQIQIQSEGAECYYKQLALTKIKKFPKKIKKQVRFK